MIGLSKLLSGKALTTKGRNVIRSKIPYNKINNNIFNDDRKIQVNTHEKKKLKEVQPYHFLSRFILSSSS